MKRVWLILAAFLGLAVQAAPASADMVYSLTQHDSTFSASNYGTVTLHDNGSGSSAYVTVTVQLASGFRFGANNSPSYVLGWSLTGNPNINVTINSSLTDSSSNFSTLSYSSSPDYTMSPFSTYNYAIDYTNSLGALFGGSDNTLVFDVKRSGAAVLASNFIANAAGYFFASDVASGTQIGGNYKEANVASNKRVPEPTTGLLLLSGLAGLTVLYRRRKMANAI